jgi:hypothetical protein
LRTGCRPGGPGFVITGYHCHLCPYCSADDGPNGHYVYCFRQITVAADPHRQPGFPPEQYGNYYVK